MSRVEPYLDSVWDRLDVLLFQADFESVAYVYRVRSDGQVQRPHLAKYEVTPDLLRVLQKEIGTGTYRLLIRRRREMVFPGIISIEGLPPRARV